MPKRISDSARILAFFTESDLGGAKIVYELIQDVMKKRLAPERAVRASKRKKKGDAPGPVAAA